MQDQKIPSTYKLSYFNIHALGEPIRFLFASGGIKFEDFRFDREGWPVIKPKTPFGKVPMLEYDGKKAHQSVAICRYLAKKAALDGKDDWENLELDAIVDTITDFLRKVQAYHYETDAGWKKTNREQLFNETLPFYLSKFDAMVKDTGYFFQDRLTWADLYFVGLLEYSDFMLGLDTVSDWPNLKALKNKVLSLPLIKNYLSERPDLMML